MLQRLKREFEDWSPEVHDLFDATKPEVVKRRDLFDRLPTLQGWTDGFTTLLGDAAHITLPNLGQGGAMAIEDAFVFGEEMEAFGTRMRFRLDLRPTKDAGFCEPRLLTVSTYHAMAVICWIAGIDCGTPRSLAPLQCGSSICFNPS